MTSEYEEVKNNSQYLTFSSLSACLQPMIPYTMTKQKQDNTCSQFSISRYRKIKEAFYQPPHLIRLLLLLLLLLLLFSHLTLTSSATSPLISYSSSVPKPPPLPILPLPSASQLSWQLGNMALFLHFGTNTFTDSEWGTGHVDPSIFNPTHLDTRQWVRVAKDAGFSRVILTAKHHDGFCLWPSVYTDYSVKSSPWKNGSGDVIAELAIAVREAGLGLGLYLSPWDRHESCYGKTIEYNEFYMGQMTELLTRYGDIKEVWLDGAKGEGEKDMEYLFESWFSLIHQHQPGAVIFSDGGPDTRWVGDEAGSAASTCWSLFNSSSSWIGNTDYKYSSEGDLHGHDWVPAECDVSIRPGWFWHPSELPKSATTLLDIYYKSVGRNCLLLLNVPPNSSGLISGEDVQVLQEFTELRQTIFSINLANKAVVTASSTRGGTDSVFAPTCVLQEGIYSYWAPEENQIDDWVVYLDLGESASFNILQIQEPIHMGQRIIEFHLDILTENGRWKTVTSGTTVGYQRLLRFLTVESKIVRFVVDKSRTDPLISYLGLYLDRFSLSSGESNTSFSSYLNGTQVIQQLRVYNQSHSASL